MPFVSPVVFGILLRLAAAFILAAMSAIVHHLAKSVPVGQIIFWRSVVALLPICAYMAVRGQLRQGLKTRRPGLHLTRGLLGALAMTFSFLSLAYLPIANAKALAFLAPVLTVPLAGLMLGEVLGPRIFAAVAMGFAGVLAMLWSSLALPGEAAVWGVAAGLGFALVTAFVRVHVKAMTATEAPATIALYFAMITSAVGLATWPLGWVPAAGATLGWLVLTGLLGGLGHVVATEAVARAPVSVLSAFDYSGLVWALAFDLVLFGVAPGLAALAGVVLITLAGGLVLWRGRTPVRPGRSPAA